MKPELFYQNENFDYRFLRNKLESYTVNLRGSEPATASNYGVFAIMPRAGVVKGFWESHGTACSSTGTLQLEHLTTGTAPESGTEVLTSDLDLDTTADTPQEGVISQNPSVVSFVKGDRFALKDAGTLTDTANLTATLVVRYKNV